MHRQPAGLGKLLQRVDRTPFAIRRAVDADHVLAAFEQCFQHAAAEGLLTIDNDSHVHPPQVVVGSARARRGRGGRRERAGTLECFTAPCGPSGFRAR